MISTRLKELRKLHSLTQEQFGSKIGAKQGHVADWERGRSAPGHEYMQNIVKAFNINLHWLLTGQGQMYLPMISEEAQQKELKQKVFNFIRNELNILENDDKVFPPDNADCWQLPLVGEIAAGDPLPFNFDVDPIKYIPISKSQLPDPRLCDALRVNGDSMEPKIEHSDIVVIKRENDYWMCNNKVVAVRTTDGLTLKKLVIDYVKNSACLIPFNPKYPIMFLEEDWEICGSLILIVRQCE